jgi:hypothetical protein
MVRMQVITVRGDTFLMAMFALFEAGSQVICTIPTPRFGYASRGANHVAPLRGADQV